MELVLQRGPVRSDAEPRGRTERLECTGGPNAKTAVTFCFTGTPGKGNVDAASNRATSTRLFSARAARSRSDIGRRMLALTSASTTATMARKLERRIVPQRMVLGQHDPYLAHPGRT